MSDISKCNGEGCSKKDSCYRYLAPSSEKWQSYISVEEPDKCEYFWVTGER